MRRAYTDVGFLANEQGQLMGLALGYDFCAEHEFGCEEMKAELGIRLTQFPIGVEDRMMTRVPEHLGFKTFGWRKDKRHKAFVPCALLHMTSRTEYCSNVPTDGAELAAWLGLTFSDRDPRWYQAERDDILSAWSSHDGFAVAVRGEENVAKLEAVYKAMTECKVSLADPSAMGFMRKSLAFVLVDALSEEMKTSVRERDEAHLRLHEAFAATGIVKELEKAGRRWYALSPRWRDGEGSELMAFLNPCEQKNYSHGWFTIGELRQWASGTGPVIKDENLEELLKAEDVDMSYHLVGGLQAFGISLAYHATPVWLDAAKTIPGMRLLVHKDSQHLMADGNYSLRVLETYLKKGRELHAAEKAAREQKKAAEVGAGA